MVEKYILMHYSVRDGEKEYGDKSLFKVVCSETTTEDEISLTALKELAYQIFGEEDEDWEYNEEENQIEGIHGEYRILEDDGYKIIPKEHFDILKIYMGSDSITVNKK
jgi:hypothetical protein